jgi:hypothetical protein
LTGISGTGETAIYNGGSSWADYWIQTITELRHELIGSGKVDEGLVQTYLAYCADRSWWTKLLLLPQSMVGRRLDKPQRRL